MSLILLAITAAIVVCVIAFYFAIYALLFMVGMTAFKWVYATEASFLMSGLAALGAALASIALVIAVVGIARNPAVRLLALAIFAIPACIAGYALIYGIMKNATDSAILLNFAGITAGVVIGIAALVNLNALGEAALSR